MHWYIIRRVFALDAGLVCVFFADKNGKLKMVYKTREQFLKDLQPDAELRHARDEFKNMGKEQFKKWQENAKNFFRNQQDIKTK